MLMSRTVNIQAPQSKHSPRPSHRPSAIHPSRFSPSHAQGPCRLNSCIMHYAFCNAHIPSSLLRTGTCTPCSESLVCCHLQPATGQLVLAIEPSQTRLDAQALVTPSSAGELGPWALGSIGIQLYCHPSPDQEPKKTPKAWAGLGFRRPNPEHEHLRESRNLTL